MSALAVNETVAVDGISNQASKSVSANQDVDSAPTGGVAAAKPGELTTRTNDTQGVITLESGHGLSTDTGDVYWNISGTPGSRRGVSLTIVGDACTITGGAGDNLPALNSDVTVKIPEEYSFSILTGDDTKWIRVYSQLINTSGHAYIAFLDDAGTPADALVFKLTPDLPSNSWNGIDETTIPDLGANPFAGKVITLITFSHGETSALVMGGTAGYD